MGVLFSRFRAKPSTKEVLEELEKEIETLEEYKRSTELQQKTIARYLVIYSLFLYFIIAGVFFLYYFPSATKDRIMYSIPILIFPFVLFVLRKFLHWYFVQKIRNNDENLQELKRRKRSLLEYAMETETYKVVKELLEKFDPDYHKKIFESRPAIEAPPPSPPLKGSFADMDVRRRHVPPKGLPPIPLGAPGQTLTLRTAGPKMLPPLHGTNPPYPFLPRPSFVVPQGPPMARPVLPRERSLLDRLVDYVVGDGPYNRYALICRQCQSHNGMALKEEFESVAFRCCYCFHWNPSRSQNRPEVPAITEAPEASSSSDEAEIETLSDVDKGAARSESIDSTKDDSTNQRLSISSDNEIQAKLEEDKPYCPSDSSEFKHYDSS